MNKHAWGVALSLVFAGWVSAATLSTDGSQPSVSAAINSASDGDTISIPAGSFTWTSGIVVAGKGVKIQGAGAGRVIGRSASVVAIGTGTKTFTTQSGLPISVGQTLVVERTGTQVSNFNPTGIRGFMVGTVASYSGTTLTMNVTSTGGSGTHPVWIISNTASTTVTHSAGSSTLIELTEDTTHHVELSGIRFKTGSGTNDYVSLDGSTGGKSILVHDCYFESTANFDCIQSYINRGVIWNCSFAAFPFSMSQLAIHLQSSDTSSWTSPSSMGMADANGDKNIYFEDCDFHAWLNATDFDSNGRAVMRHCLFNNAGIGTHGADTSQYGQRHFEVYDSEFVFNGFSDGNTFNLNWWFYIRGGTAVICDNIMPNISSQDSGDKLEINMTVMNLQRNAGPNPAWGAGIPGIQYPCPRQVGMGRVTGAAGVDSVTYVGDSEPLYIWNNTGSYSAGTTDFGDTSIANPDFSASYIVAGRDYFNNGTPKPGYVKYTYPHPVRGGGASAPVITTQPVNQTVSAGQTATFTVSASGTAPLSYQWKRGTINVGTNSATLSISNAQSADAGSYTCVVSNAAGSATSSAATLTVNTTSSPVYYIDQTAGNDNNSGTSPGAAWKNCPGMAAYTGAGTLSPGATVYFDSADTWLVTGGQGIYLVGGVTYLGDSWGSGQRAEIKANADLDAGVVRFRDHATLPTVFKGFNVNANSKVNTGVDINHRYWSLMNGATKRVENCEVHHVWSRTSLNQYKYGIVVSNHGGTGGYCENVEILNCSVHDISRDVICLYPGDENADCRIRNVTVRGCEAYNSGQDPDYSAGAGIIAKGYVVDAYVENNYVHNVQGAGLFINSNETNHYTGIGPTNVHLRYNIVNVGTVHGGIRLYDGQSGKDPKDVKIYGNIVYNNTAMGGLVIDNDLGNANKLWIYNNTFYNAPVYVQNSAATFPTFEFKNNIVYYPAGTPITGSSHFTASSNNLTTNPSFQNTANLPTGFTGTFGVNAAPNNDGLSIAGTPGIDGGTALASGFNGSINTVARPAGGGWDIGAYEQAGQAAVPPTITAQPISETVTAGQSASFSVIAGGTAPLSYLWRKNGVSISGATGSSYTTPATTAADNGALYSVVVSNSAGNVTSNNATLTVNSAAVAPSITTQPANKTVTVGQTASFSVVASGTAPLTYQWQKNGSNISGATSASYITAATVLGDNGAVFRAVVTNPAGNVISNGAALTVNASAGSGTGLLGEYYNNSDLTLFVLSRVDATINFGWSQGSPDATVGPDTFSVRWKGQVQPKFTESYTFYTYSDDGVRLWVNGQQIVNNWTDHSPAENSGVITLTAGQKYDIKLEYYENGGGANLALSWSSASQPKQIIPQSQLYPAPSTAVAEARVAPRNGFAGRMVGGRFQGSADATNWVDLGSIISAPAVGVMSTFTLSSVNYRYLRYMAPNGGYGNIAELEFRNSGVVLTGNPIGTPSSWSNLGNTFYKALDGSLNTFFDAPGADGDWVGIDRNSPPTTLSVASTALSSDSPPAIFTSGPVTSVNPAHVGESVVFSAAASETASGSTLTYTWDFGDGESATGASVTHSYAAPGIYTATVTVSDVEGASVSSSTQVTVEGGGGAENSTKEPLTVAKLQMNLNFAKADNDSYRVSGVLPTLPANFKARGVRASIDVGGAVVQAVLDSKGRARNKNGTLALRFKKSKGWAFQASMKAGSWRDVWADLGLDNINVKTKLIAIPVTLTLDGQIFAGNKPVKYSAKQAKAGNAK